MELNANVKKIVAMLALIDDTQDQINRIKAEQELEVRALKIAYDVRLRELRRVLDEHHNMLTSVCGPEYDEPRIRAASGRMVSPATSDAQIFRARAVRYIGEQVLNPTLEPEVKNEESIPILD
jgi:hypothetical protein